MLDDTNSIWMTFIKDIMSQFECKVLILFLFFHKGGSIYEDEPGLSQADPHE